MSEKWARIVAEIRRSGRQLLHEHEGYALLQDAGLPSPRHVFLEGEELEGDLDALAESEVVLKIVSPQILHKSDVGGVRFLTADARGILESARDMRDRVRERCPDAELHGVLVVEKVRFETNVPGTEMLLSLRRDPAFGPVLMVGPGGVLTEWYGKMSAGTAHQLLAADALDVERDLGRLAATPFGRLLLRPSRLFSSPPVSEEQLGRGLRALAEIAGWTDEEGAPLFEEVELNPVAVVDGELRALDALVPLAPPAAERRRPRPIAKIGPLLHPRSAAVYGASASSPNAGRIILSNLKASQGLDYGRLYAVHPRAERIDGVRCVASTAELPEKVDLAVLSIPAESAGGVIAEIVEQDRAESLILIPGGFAETGAGSRAEEIQETLATSRDHQSGGPVLVGGNCLGIVSKREYNTFFLPSYKLPFHDAPGDDLVVISQSGAYLVTFTSNLDGIIFPRVSVSYGNEMDLTASDFFEYYLEHEPDAQTFAFYIEGFQPGEGERFLRLVRRARGEGRSVTVYKAGQTPTGAKAAASHTASVAGDYEVVRSLLQQAGATVCQTLNMFEDVTKIQTMLRGRGTAGRRVGVITNAGFEAGAISDHLYSLELAEFSSQTREKLEACLPAIAHCGNPIDCTPMTRTPAFVEAVEAMVEAKEVDAVIVSAVPATPSLDVLAPDLSGQHQENAFALGSLPRELARVFADCDKPFVVAIDSGRLYDPSVLLLERAGVPVYRKIDRASRALSLYLGQA